MPGTSWVEGAWAVGAWAADSWVDGDAPPAEAPAAITDLGATAVSAGRIRLTWTPSATVASHKIHRSLTALFTAGAGNLIDTIGPGGQYDDLTVSPETQYFYQVIGTNAAGDSATSNEANTTTPAAPAPGAQGRSRTTIIRRRFR
jgi:hypothetical protein